MYMGGNNENDRVVSPQSVPIHLEKNDQSMHLFSLLTDSHNFFFLCEQTAKTLTRLHILW